MTEVEYLRNQLIAARNEISNLRQQVKNLTFVQKKDIEQLENILKDFRCDGCQAVNKTQDANIEPTSVEDHQNSKTLIEDSMQFNPIGFIKTQFPEKKGVPRQPSINKIKGCIEINREIFTNPEHSLQGLEEFSHLWIIYNFHKNNSHAKAKVAPPRLDGNRVGVFSTRSPHRPCPIGLSLVEIDKIENASIHFTGTDMIHGTPVLDIKPYIPFYDAPSFVESGRLSVDDTIDFSISRQEPDGEESEFDLNGAVGLPQQINHPPHLLNQSSNSSPTNGVKIPNWIVADNALKVSFNERAEEQIKELNIDRQSIIDILKTDPRSVYLRTKYSSQIFTFQLSEVTVTCKFDDKNSMVTIVQIRRTESFLDL